MYHEDLNPKDTIKIETVIDIDSKNFKAEEAKSLSPPPPPPPPRVLTSIKRWSAISYAHLFLPTTMTVSVFVVSHPLDQTIYCP